MAGTNHMGSTEWGGISSGAHSVAEDKRLNQKQVQVFSGLHGFRLCWSQFSLIYSHLIVVSDCDMTDRASVSLFCL
jgi:hypothetical protein